jgi:hypothetical protein
VTGTSTQMGPARYMGRSHNTFTTMQECEPKPPAPNRSGYHRKLDSEMMKVLCCRAYEADQQCTRDHHGIMFAAELMPHEAASMRRLEESGKAEHVSLLLSDGQDTYKHTGWKLVKPNVG